ncbi:MAG: hypothetical protein ABJJ69_21555 [Paracoccaceae bacterium]
MTSQQKFKLILNLDCVEVDPDPPVLCPEDDARIHIGEPKHNHIDTGAGDAQQSHDLTVAEGRYSGGDQFADLELRVDHELGIVSGDLFRRSATDRTWVASFRTTPGTHLTGSAFEIVAVDRFDATAQGTLHVERGTNTVRASLNLGGRLDGLPVNREFGFYLSVLGTGMRRLGLEIELEHGVTPPASASVDGQEYTFASVMAQAGFDVESVGVANILPPPTDDEGWSEKSLENVMHDLAQSDTRTPGFDLRMLWISRMNRPRVLGVMFDIEGAMQRQGFAVCRGALEDRDDIPADRLPAKTLQTTVHEAGHALNLAHRFEREVGRADSLSPMNYDWKYRGGHNTEAFWRDFRFKFDRDELEFLRHGSFRDVVPGGAPFHSVRYWADGDGGYSPYVTEVPLRGWELRLSVPQNPVHVFGQPVTVGIELINRTGRPQPVPDFLLDQKAGFIQFMIEREQGGGTHFHALAHRCYDVSPGPEGTVVLQDGEALLDNANLTFGVSGFPFAEPGNYRIRAVLSIYTKDQSGEDIEQISVSNTERIRVSMPQTRDEENDAFVLLQPDFGRYFAYGGLDRLSGDEDTLAEIAERRDRTKSRVVRDPIAAHIHRSMGFNANRAVLRFADGEFRRRDRQPERAREHFARLDRDSLRCVDHITREATLNAIENL